MIYRYILLRSHTTHCHTGVLCVCKQAHTHAGADGGVWVSVNYQKMKSLNVKQTLGPILLHYVKSSLPFSSYHPPSCSLKIGTLSSS